MQYLARYQKIIDARKANLAAREEEDKLAAFRREFTEQFQAKKRAARLERVQQKLARRRIRLAHSQLGEGMTALWYSMHSRCRCDPNYVGRVKVCARWSSFNNFWADMRERPGPEYSLGRIDNDGDYEPGNCRWELAWQQASNKRGSRTQAHGVVGVYWEEGRGTWRAEGAFKGKRCQLYRGDSFDEAVAARKRWEEAVRDPALGRPPASA